MLSSYAIDIFCVVHAAKISWIKILSGNNDEKQEESYKKDNFALDEALKSM